MLGATLQGLFVSRKYTFLEFWDMPDLDQAVFLQFFVVFGPLMRPLVTKNTIIKFASVTDYKIDFCVVKPNPLSKASCEVNLLICVSG